MIRALVFDVFGTVVDWRSSIIREGELLGRTKNLKVDWAAFADAWRAGYRPAMFVSAGISLLGAAAAVAIGRRAAAVATPHPQGLEDVRATETHQVAAS